MVPAIFKNKIHGFSHSPKRKLTGGRCTPRTSDRSTVYQGHALTNDIQSMVHCLYDSDQRQSLNVEPSAVSKKFIRCANGM